MLRSTCTKLYAIITFFKSYGFLSFIYLGPAYMQKYRYVANIVSNGPGELIKNQSDVLGSIK